jgi:hypothetical protein
MTPATPQAYDERSQAMATASELFTQIEEMASAIVAKSAVPINKGDAYARLFKEHPELYHAYVDGQQAEQEARYRWAERHGSALSGLMVKVAKACAPDDPMGVGIAVIKQEAPGLLEFYQQHSGVPVL